MKTKREFTSQADLQTFVAKYVADMLAGNESEEHDRETKKRMRQLQEQGDLGSRTNICIEQGPENTVEFRFTREDGSTCEIGYPSLAFFVLQFVADTISDEDLEVRVGYGTSLPSVRRV